MTPVPERDPYDLWVAYRGRRMSLDIPTSRPGTSEYYSGRLVGIQKEPLNYPRLLLQLSDPASFQLWSQPSKMQGVTLLDGIDPDVRVMAFGQAILGLRGIVICVDGAPPRRPPSHYPDTCPDPKCASPAYLGAIRAVDCSRPGCKFYRGWAVFRD